MNDVADPAQALEREIAAFVERVTSENPLGAEVSLRGAFAIAIIFPELALSAGVGPDEAMA